MAGLETPSSCLSLDHRHRYGSLDVLSPFVCPFLFLVPLFLLSFFFLLAGRCSLILDVDFNILSPTSSLSLSFGPEMAGLDQISLVSLQ